MNEEIEELQAFPDEVNYGMTLRDYFAAKGIIAYHSDGSFSNFENAAIWCYAMADAMLKAREA